MRWNRWTPKPIRSFPPGPVNRREFAEAVIVTDLEVGRLALVFEILTAMADAGVGVESVAVADCRGTVDGDMGIQLALFTDDNAGTDDAVGTNGA